MKFPTELIEAKFIKRYKRFFVDVEIIGKNGPETVVAHCPNTGSMKGLLNEGCPCRITHVNDPNRKLKYTLQMLKTPTSWVGTNTGLPNNLVFEAWQEGRIEHLKKFSYARKEVKVRKETRLDMAFWNDQEGLRVLKSWNPDHINQFKFHFVEVKNVTLANDGVASFPDSVSTRGQKHLQELMSLIDQGHTCEILFTIQRTDCGVFRPEDEIDPTYGKLLRKAKDHGVIISPFVCEPKKSSIQLDGSRLLPVEL